MAWKQILKKIIDIILTPKYDPDMRGVMVSDLKIKYNSIYQNFVLYQDSHIDLYNSAASLSALFHWFPFPRGLQCKDTNGRFIDIIADRHGMIRIPQDLISEETIDIRPLYGPWYMYILSLLPDLVLGLFAVIVVVAIDIMSS